MNTKFKAISLSIILAFCLQAAYAIENIGNPGHRVAGNGNRTEAADCRPASSFIDLNINNVRAELLNGGDMWWDLVSAARYEIPYNPSELQRGPSSLFAGSVWVGGIDQGGQLKVAAATYRQNGNDYFPGPLDATGSTNLTTCNLWDHHYQVFSADIAKRDSLLSLGALTQSNCPSNLLLWPATGNVYDGDMAGSQDMAPFNDVNGDGVYDPVAGDYPSIYGLNSTQVADQMIWWVYNDKGNVHTESGGEAIGLEVHTLAFAFKTNDEVNDMTFYRYTLYNKATSELDSTYMGQWTDPDLGCYIDDYIACDTQRSMGIVYNASAYDGGNPSACVLNYGNQPPFLAIDYFKGPLNQFGKELGMSSFLYYNNDFTALGNPQHTSNYYGYLSGSWVDGTPFTQGGDAYGGTKRTKYVFPDPPNKPKPAWSECSENTPAGDRRMVQASGPFKLEPGATNEVVIGVVWVRPPVGTYPCPSFALLNAADDKAQALFNSNFKILNGPDAPNLNIVELDQKLIIQLVNTNLPTVEGYSESDPVLTAANVPDSTFNFQGYQIYQLVNATVSNDQLTDPSQARLIFQCDIKDTVSKLINFVFDPNLNASVPIDEVDGTNQGIKHSFEVDNDAFATGSEQLVNFQQYYFLAVSYAYNNYKDPITGATQLAPYLEGRRNIKVYTAIPHKPAPENSGMAIHSTYGDGPQIMRQEGTGNGGNWVQLTNQTIDEIISNTGVSATNHPLYNNGEGPVIVKVVDPKNIPSANFELLFRDTTLGTHARHYQKVDTSICSIKITENGKDSIYCKPDTIPLTVVVGGRPDTLGNGEIVIVDGRDSTIGYKDTTICLHTKTVGHDTSICKNVVLYHIAGHDTKNGTDTTLKINRPAITQLEALDDTAAWTLRMLQGDSIVADKSIQVGNEQVIPDWGLSVYIQQVRNPGSNSSVDNNGYIGASITYASPQTTWLTGIANQPGGATFHWIRSGRYKSTGSSTAGNDYAGDTLEYYANILGATWAPYNLAARDLNFGPAYNDPLTQGTLNRMDSLTSVDIVFTNDTSKWTRCIVVEANPEQNLSQGGVVKGAMRQHQSMNQDGSYSGGVGFSWFPGYAIDPERGRRLNILFAEDSRDVAENGDDMIWNPTADLYSPTGEVLMGGRHYIYIMRDQYDKDAMYQTNLTPTSSGTLNVTGARAVYSHCIWTTMPMLASGFTLLPISQGLIPTQTTIQIRVDKAYSILSSDVSENNSFPHYTFSTSDIATTTNSITIAKNALDTINVVPNPYYGYAGYEINQLDTRVRITNLPPKCEITIYTLSGVLVKRVLRDDPTSTYFDWDLKNNLEVPIASGAYLIHVNCDGIGEVTLKWFGVMRPVDLSSF